MPVKFASICSSPDTMHNLVALRKAKTQWSFGHSECNRVDWLNCQLIFTTSGTSFKILMQISFSFFCMPLPYSLSHPIHPNSHTCTYYVVYTLHGPHLSGPLKLIGHLVPLGQSCCYLRDSSSYSSCLVKVPQ